jgi:hypothetical protein
MSAAAFIQELRADPRFAGTITDDLEAALESMDLEGAELVDADNLYRAISWIMAQPDSIEKRLAAISRLNALGKVENLDMRQFYYGPQ